MKVLHAAAEIFPHVKVGGLADVMGALPLALRKENVDVRLLLPAYPALMKVARIYGIAAEFPDLMGGGPAKLLLADVPGSVPIYLLDAPGFFARDCGPYDDWGDSHRRFAALAWVVAQIGLYGDVEGMRPDVVHAHDWQTALAPVFINLANSEYRPKTVLTVHNLTYQGVFPRQVLDEIWLPREAFHMNGAEYFGQINFLKAGLSYANKITTVSPTYAKEIQTKDGGCTLEGTLQRRSADLVGILNGVDEVIWNPSKDSHLRTAFTTKNLKLNKGYNKKVFQYEMSLNEDPNAMLFGIVSRFDSIKGLDLVLPNIEYMISMGAQLAILGRGDYHLESAFNGFVAKYPGSVAIFIGHDEGKAHRLMAGADVLMVPSRSEPCGLTQLYAMRYGTLPLVRKTGGLADTVIDTDFKTLEDGTATGFIFFDAESWHLGEAITRAIRLYRSEPEEWHRLQLHAMSQHFTWELSAKQYVGLYRELLEGGLVP
jgi:starch synthase